jgi:large subunit ribosomal protein L17
MSSIKYRHLGRDSAHRRALLRNLVTSLIEHESISTTWAKAKEAQRMAEKLITMGKKNTNASRVRAESVLFDPHKHLPKLFGELRERYASRPGGYTRVLRTEAQDKDQAESAILHLVDGPKDMRFAMTAKALVRQREEGLPMHHLTAQNIRKVTRFRDDGEDALEAEVKRLEQHKARTIRREEKDFKEEGIQLEWVRNARAPGKVRKRRMATGEPGENRFEFLMDPTKRKKRDIDEAGQD